MRRYMVYTLFSCIGLCSLLPLSKMFLDSLAQHGANSLSHVWNGQATPGLTPGAGSVVVSTVAPSVAVTSTLPPAGSVSPVVSAPAGAAPVDTVAPAGAAPAAPGSAGAGAGLAGGPLAVSTYPVPSGFVQRAYATVEAQGGKPNYPPAVLPDVLPPTPIK